MQHDGASVPVLAHINPHMGNAGGVVCTRKEQPKVPGCGLETGVEDVVKPLRPKSARIV